MDLCFVFGQLGLNGLVRGVLYSLLGIAFLLGFSPRRFYDFTLGSAVVLAAYTTYGLQRIGGFPVVLAAGAAIILAGAFCGVLELGLYRKIRDSKGGALYCLLASLGTSICVVAVIAMAFGPQALAFERGWVGGKPFELGTLMMARSQAVNVVTCAGAIVLIAIYIRRSSEGVALRAVAGNAALAELRGLQVPTITTKAVILGGALAGVAGIMLGLESNLSVEMGADAFLLGVVAALLGGGTGIGSALIGGLVLGMAESIGGFALGDEWQRPLLYGGLLLALLWKPTFRGATL